MTAPTFETRRFSGQRHRQLQMMAEAVRAGEKVLLASPSQETADAYKADLRAILGPEAGWAGSVEFLPLRSPARSPRASASPP